MIRKLLTLSAFLLTLIASVNNAHAEIVFSNEFLIENAASDKWVIDVNQDTSSNIGLQFGNKLTPSDNGLINWNMASGYFQSDHDIDLLQNQIKDFGLESLSSPPSSPVDGQIYYNTNDGHPYVYDGVGTAWVDLAYVSATSDKVVSVGPGLDYATIQSAAGYLNARSGGIMLLSAGTHSITSVVNLTNITMIGKDASKTTIAVSGDGQMDSFDTSFADLTLDINSINDYMAIDIQNGSSAVYMSWVDIDIQDAGDVLVGSNEPIAPTVAIKMVNCEEVGGSGTLIKPKLSANINPSSTMYISSASGNSLLQFNDWDVTIAGYGNVYTSGAISTIPSNTIYVYPGMNLQGAINSLSGGGSIVLLPGTHTINSPILITNNSIQISGYGDKSVIAASGFTSPTDITTAAIQVGAANGTSPVDNVSLKNFKLTVSGDSTAGTDIHGIRFTGGSDHIIDNVTVEKTAGQSGTSATARMGIQILDSTTQKLIRPRINNCRIFGNIGASAYFTDGIHVTSDPAFGGVFGYGSGITGAYVEGNSVDYVRETAYVFYGAINSSLSNTRASRMGASGGSAYGIFLGSITNSKMDGNVFSGSLSTTSVAIGIESFNAGSLKETKDSIFSNNVIEGAGNGGIGFGTGFQIGNGANTGVHRNTFQNNTVREASNAGGATAFIFRGNADDNLIADNDMDGGTNPWAIGINLQSSTQERNRITGNRYNNVTQRILDAGTSTQIGVMHREDSNPTANDDQTIGYYIGTIWVNTSTKKSFISVSDTVGAAVWKDLDSDTVGEEYRWLNIGAGIMSSATLGSIAGGNSAAILFDGANSSNGAWSFPVPDDWQTGTDINIDVFWSPSTSAAGNINLDLSYASWGSGQTISGAGYTTLSNIVATPAVTDQLVTSSFGLTSANLAANRMINIKILRDPANINDTYAGDININKIRIRYTGKKIQ